MRSSSSCTKPLGAVAFLLSRLFVSLGIVGILCAPAAAETRSSTVCGGKINWTLTPEQTAKLDPSIAQLELKQQASVRQILKLREQMDKLFLEPLPDRKAILALQGQINGILADLRVRQWKQAFQIRELLSAQQRKRLGCLGPNELLSGTELTAPQEEDYYRLVRPYLITSLAASKKLSSLRLEQTILLQEVDLVHECHESRLDLAALLANQKQMNEENSSMAMERLRVAITIHNLLSPTQKKSLGSVVEINIPDPIGVSLKNESSSRIPSADVVYKGASISKEQRAKYNRLMESQAANSESYRKQRGEFLAQRKQLLAQSQLSAEKLEEVQEKINDLDNTAALKRLKNVSDVRDVLTAEQRHEVFNRHHPKIWRDAGINAAQDKLIMAIHMRIETADRDGKRRMTALVTDMTRRFYEINGNDDEILAAQLEYDRAEKDMIKKQLDGLFEGRDVLTSVQRQKLVHLMELDNKGAH